MSKPAFRDDDDYPFEDWADDAEVAPDELCGDCLGEGTQEGDVPCYCMVAEAFRLYPAAADGAEPNPDCFACGGDGADRLGRLCPCMLTSFREQHEAIDWA